MSPVQTNSGNDGTPKVAKRPRKREMGAAVRSTVRTTETSNTQAKITTPTLRSDGVETMETNEQPLERSTHVAIVRIDTNNEVSIEYVDPKDREPTTVQNDSVRFKSSTFVCLFKIIDLFRCNFQLNMEPVDKNTPANLSTGTSSESRYMVGLKIDIYFMFTIGKSSSFRPHSLNKDMSTMP